MPRAEIYIEDAEQGASVRFVFPEGFKPESNAHQMANILRAKLDEMVKAGDLTALDEPQDQGDMVAANDALAELVTKDE